MEVGTVVVLEHGKLIRALVELIADCRSLELVDNIVV